MEKIKVINELIKERMKLDLPINDLLEKKYKLLEVKYGICKTN